jgi:hypothetical protein
MSFGSVRLKCVGYQLYGARVPRHASTCPRHNEKKRKTLKEYKRKADDGQHAFIDETRGFYRCKWCAGALFLIRKLERDLKQFWVRAKPNENVPKIQSLKELLALRRDCSKLSYKDDSGAVVTFDPHAFKPGTPKRKRPRPRANNIPQATGLLIKNSRRANVVKGLCQFCGKLVFSNHEGRAAKVHMKCYQNQLGFKKGIPPEPPKRGRPVELDRLRRHYSWAIRHKLGGESLGDIADEFGVARETVVNGIEFIVARLPEPDMVHKQFRDRISRLRSP